MLQIPMFKRLISRRVPSQLLRHSQNLKLRRTKSRNYKTFRDLTIVRKWAAMSLTKRTHPLPKTREHNNINNRIRDQLNKSLKLKRSLRPRNPHPRPLNLKLSKRPRLLPKLMIRPTSRTLRSRLPLLKIRKRKRRKKCILMHLKMELILKKSS